MPHTMADELALMEDPKRAAVTKGILTAGQVLDKLPVENVTTLETEGFRWKSLPSVSFNLPNENYTEGTGKIESVAWGVVRIGHDIDIDRIYDKTAHFVKPKTLYTEQTLEAINFTINDSLINGDKAMNPRGFDGFKKISAGLPARQIVDAGQAKYGGTGTVLDISAGGASSAVRQGFFDALLRAKRVTEGSQPDLAIMNENVLDLFDSMLRREGLYKVNEDQFEREVTSWKKITFVDAGYKDPDGEHLSWATTTTYRVTLPLAPASTSSSSTPSVTSASSSSRPLTLGRWVSFSPARSSGLVWTGCSVPSSGASA